MLGSCGRCERASVCFRRFDRVSIFSNRAVFEKKEKEIDNILLYYEYTL